MHGISRARVPFTKHPFVLIVRPTMHPFHVLIDENLAAAWMVLAIAFALLAKSADWFVDGAVALANKCRIPRLVIGIVLFMLASGVT